MHDAWFLKYLTKHVVKWPADVSRNRETRVTLFKHRGQVLRKGGSFKI